MDNIPLEIIDKEIISIEIIPELIFTCKRIYELCERRIKAQPKHIINEHCWKIRKVMGKGRGYEWIPYAGADIIDSKDYYTCLLYNLDSIPDTEKGNLWKKWLFRWLSDFYRGNRSVLVLYLLHGDISPKLDVSKYISKEENNLLEQIKFNTINNFSLYMISRTITYDILQEFGNYLQHCNRQKIWRINQLKDYLRIAIRLTNNIRLDKKVVVPSPYFRDYADIDDDRRTFVTKKDGEIFDMIVESKCFKISNRYYSY